MPTPKLGSKPEGLGPGPIRPDCVCRGHWWMMGHLEKSDENCSGETGRKWIMLQMEKRRARLGKFHQPCGPATRPGLAWWLGNGDLTILAENFPKQG